MIAALVLSFLSFLAALSEVGRINARDTESSISDATCQLPGNKSSVRDLDSRAFKQSASV